jgi:hypothetical protein
MLGFVRTDNESLVSCLGDPHRAVAAYHELLRRGQDWTRRAPSVLACSTRIRPSVKAAAVSSTTWSTPAP